ncbi:TIGR01459 family HAD-type hydrolase [Kordiimonas sp. SCSIO 12603]|uniref:TIGR01459 family HAD-type hydrolase n=1 Tax=Kordiimonas sp. SCSIO 12603 TaxID=2829596 RepID=UPI0021027AE2|nr:TIGR01459 family HAD-type hydrolase [Kordiimonas sp. SCSIO 12603]UTW58437.1 TIGR01459 family HAD-type hydrolase [Kordiimonas sp. SCSIO 12603]
MPNSGGRPIDLISGIREFSDQLDLIICDLWGVMHDGISLHPSAEIAIQKARAAGIKTVFLSNAPRPRFHVRDHLISMGLSEDLTDFVVTSGGLARDEVRANFRGKKLYHLGPAGDRNTVEGLPVVEVNHPDEADVILATDLDYRDVEKHRNWLKIAAEKQTPLLCANPDRIVHVGDKLYQCAGAVADLYEEIGGEVRWFGKPTAYALQSCLKECGLPADTPKNRILMVGDSLQTDMAGALAAGYKGLFIAGGIHRMEFPELERQAEDGRVSVAQFRKIFGAGKAVPHAVMQQLSW